MQYTMDRIYAVPSDVWLKDRVFYDFMVFHMFLGRNEDTGVDLAAVTSNS